jgi:hypothetical protein
MKYLENKMNLIVGLSNFCSNGPNKGMV